jgi:hypothetical protein
MSNYPSRHQYYKQVVLVSPAYMFGFGVKILFRQLSDDLSARISLGIFFYFSKAKG